MVTCQPSDRKQPSGDVTVANELFICPFIAAIDTREQMPWGFQGIILGGKRYAVRRKITTLKTGDYSIVDHEQEIVIERKSVSDMLGSITHGHERFKREHERMAEIVAAGGFACVVIEGDLAKICDDLEDPWSERQIRPTTVIGVTASWPQRYRVPWFFAGDRRRAELLAFRILWKWFEGKDSK